MEVQNFLIIFIVGHRVLCIMVQQACSCGGSYAANDYILEKVIGDLVVVHGISFRDDMSTYFSQCPALVEKIKDKTYRIKDMVTIVRYYNSSCR